MLCMCLYMTVFMYIVCVQVRNALTEQSVLKKELKQKNVVMERLEFSMYTYRGSSPLSVWLLV